MRGDTVDGTQISGAREKDRTTTYGFTLGGPIVKNKLFFFVNAELSQIPSVANRWRARADESVTPDATKYLSYTTVADMERVSAHVKENTVMTQVLSQTSLLTRATRNFSRESTGTSTPRITSHCVTTIPTTYHGQLLTHLQWMVVHVLHSHVPLSILCHMQLHVLN